MPRRARRSDPETLRRELVALVGEMERDIRSDNLRLKVLALIPVFHKMRDLGSSLIPSPKNAARKRILFYLQRYPLTVIHGDELMVVSGINEWPRRIRELRVEHGWAIVSGITAKEMYGEDDFPVDGIDVASIKTDDYILVNESQDRDMAFRWNVANEIRRSTHGVRSKILEFLQRNIGKQITGEELRYVAGNKTEWARRVRELRTEHGWPVVTKNTGRPDMPIGTYMLEENRQSPADDRVIPDPIRRAVLRRDNYTCKTCMWNRSLWNKDDARHLELHHIVHHAYGGPNTAENLTTLCTVCHDDAHR